MGFVYSIMDVLELIIGLFSLLLLHLTSDVTSRKYKYEKYILDPNVDTLYGRDIPMLKMFKRQLRHFEEGRRASITLVFYSSHPVTVRWFTMPSRLYLTGSAVENMIPIEGYGDDEYKITFQRSGDVIATTLSIPDFSQKFPRDFQTVLSSVDGTMQYQLRTSVAEAISYRLDNIDSPEWLAIPPPLMQFRNKHPMKVHCKVFVPNEKKGFLSNNELNLLRAIPSEKNTSAKINFQEVKGIHQDEVSHAEESPDKTQIIQAIRKEIHQHHDGHGPHHTIYEIKLRSSNASKDLEGIYQCVIERQYDKLIVVSSVTVRGNNISPFPDVPRADLLSCESTKYDALNKHIKFTARQATCIRCRGIGYPPPQVGIYNHRDEEVLISRGGSVTKYMNVADAGVPEAAYTWISPTRNMFQNPMKDYTCRATNDRGSSSVSFRIWIDS